MKNYIKVLSVSALMFAAQSQAATILTVLVI